jgi:pimeloyl-ACP methyl ester carboxylesterase
MRWFEFDGIRVFYERQGSGSPIVFLHNGGTSHELWRRQIEYFSERYDVIAPDLVGFGRSDRPDIPYDQALYLRMLERMVEELELDQVILVGNCIGSATSMRYAEQHPERVSAVVLVNVLTSDIALAGELGPLARLAGVKRLRPLTRRLATLPIPRRVQAPMFERTLFGRGGDRAFIERLHELYRDTGQAVAMVKVAEAISSFGPLSRSSATRELPLSIVHGEDNHVLPLQHARDVIEALAPDERHIIREGGHLTPTEHATQLNGIIDSFLARVAPNPAGAKRIEHAATNA